MDGPVELPDKLFYKIGEVSRLIGAEPHVLRYWEKEFSLIRPRKSRGGQRLYRRIDVEFLLRIKTLLRDEGFTIAGAKKKIAQERKASHKAANAEQLTLDAAAERVSEQQTQRLMDEVERLKAENAELKAAREAMGRRLQAAHELLRVVQRELYCLLEHHDVIKQKARP